VTEIRLEALWARLHGTSLPTRFATLLGKLVGAGKAHRSTRTTPVRGVERPLVETGPTPRRKVRARPATAATGVPAAAPVVKPAEAATAAPRPPEAAAPAPRSGDTAAPAASAPPPVGLPSSPPAPASSPAPLLALAPAPGSSPSLLPPPASLPVLAAAAAAASAASPPPPTTVLASAVSTAATDVVSLPPPSIDIEEDLEESVDELLGMLEAAPPGSAERLYILRRLRPFANDRQLEDRLALWRARVAEGDEEAARALGAIADREAIPALLDLLPSATPSVKEAALAALRAITLHDLGQSRWRWARWWREFSGKHRVEWLLDALDSREPELRLEAARELERLSGRYVGYHFDLGKRDREEARRRWQDWWQTTGKTAV
jgi:hypothetical protein